MKRPLLLVVIVFLLGSASPFCARAAVEANKGPTVSRVSVGFLGAYKTGQWTNLEVIIEGATEPCLAEVTCTLADGDGTPAMYRTSAKHAVQLLPGKPAAASLPIKLGRRGGDAVINVVSDGQLLTQKLVAIGSDDWPQSVESSQPLIVNLGGGMNLELKTTANDPQNYLREPRVVELTEVGQLPIKGVAYDSANVVVLCTSKPSLYQNLSEQSARVQALDDWVKDGGRLILSTGRNADVVLAEGAPLARFAPGKFLGISSLFRSNRVENYAESSDALDAVGGDDHRLQIAKLTDIVGQVEVREGEWPLVVRRTYGFGEIVFVAFDLDAAPVNQWKGRTRLFEKLLGQSLRPTQSAKNTAGNMVSTVGYDDLGGQLRVALDQFTDVEMVSFGLVALLIVIYLFCVGPGDYWLVKKILRRMELTWITFPLLVGLFCLAAYLLAYRWKGSSQRVNQVEIVDVDVATAQARGTTWCNLFSPRAATMQVALAPEFPTLIADSVHTQISWLGTPGTGFGGMYQARASGAVFNADYQFAPELDQLQGLPVAVWSTRGVVGRWHGNVGDCVTAELKVNASGNLLGKLSHHLGEFKLTQCKLLHGNWVYNLGNLAAGEEYEIDYRANPQSFDIAYKHDGSLATVKGRLADSQNVSDMISIVKGLMFYEKLGGEGFITLQDDLYRDVDFSHILGGGNAILLAMVDNAGATVLRDGKPLVGEKDRRWKFIRLVLPVTPAASLLPEQPPIQEPAP